MAGFDPATFWSLTPRLYVLRMKAAARRSAMAQAQAAEAAWIGVRATHTQLLDFIDVLIEPRTPLPPEALPGALRAASKDLPRITMAEYLKSKGA